MSRASRASRGVVIRGSDEPCRCPECSASPDAFDADAVNRRLGIPG